MARRPDAAPNEECVLMHRNARFCDSGSSWTERGNH